MIRFGRDSSGGGNHGWKGHCGKEARHDALSGVTGWTIHDLRRMAQSLLSRCGVNADIAERCLGHVIAGVRGVYDRHSFLEEKRAPFEALAAEIERIINPQENVI